MVHLIKTAFLASPLLWCCAGMAQTTPAATLLGHAAAVNSIDLSPDGKYLISGGKDETIRVWNLDNKQSEKTIKTTGSSVKRVTFKSDGTKFLAALYGRFMEVDFKSFKQKLSKKNTHSAFVETCCYSPNDNFILTSSWRDKTLVVWKAVNFKKQVETEEVTWVDNAIFNKSSALIFSGGHDNLVKIWDVGTGSLIKSFAGHDDWIYDLCLSADEKLVYSGSFDKTIKIWEVASGKNIGSLKGHTEGIVCMDISKDGKYLVSGGMDKTIIIWDLRSKTEVKKWVAHDAAIMDLKFSANHQALYSCSIDKTIKVWDTNELQ